MKTDLSQMRLSGVGVALLVLCIGTGGALSALLSNPVPAVIGVLAGFYLLRVYDMATASYAACAVNVAVAVAALALAAPTAYQEPAVGPTPADSGPAMSWEAARSLR